MPTSIAPIQAIYGTSTDQSREIIYTNGECCPAEEYQAMNDTITRPENSEFWMIFVEGSGGYAQKHFFHEDALNEAKRILKKTHKKIYILHMTEMLFYPESEPIVIPSMH